MADSSDAAFNASDHPHRRYNWLTRRWILCSPHRAKRPWQGQSEAIRRDPDPEYDPSCYLCPGNRRAATNADGTPRINATYDSTFVFGNDYPALLDDTPDGSSERGGGLLRTTSARGECQVICFSPHHSRSLAQMTDGEVRHVVDEFTRVYESLASRWAFVQIFENKGAMIGCSNPHPHGQVWATDRLPAEMVDETAAFREWRTQSNSRGCLLCDYVALELAEAERIVSQNEHFVALVPFWAYWPFETLVLPRAHHASLATLSSAERDALAAILRDVTCRYDNIFSTSFPYSMGVHQLNSTDEMHLHLHFYPPLLRSATVRKFLTGYEMFAELCRDITAEQAAERLRAMPTVHYTATLGDAPSSV